KPCRLALRIAQVQEGIVIDRHVPEISGGVSFDNGEIAEEDSGQINQMHALVYQLPAARKFGVGPPFAVVANAAALTIPRPDEHERTERAGVEDFSCPKKGRMVAVVVAD